MSRNFPLLTQIDENLPSTTVEWNENAFQTLLTSNLPMKTVIYYAIDVGLRRLEQSLYETYWDATADALNDLSQYLFNSTVNFDDQSYLNEGRYQFLLYSAIAMIKMNMIRRRSTHDAKMSCAAICSLLFQENLTYRSSEINDEYSSCRRSMYGRYLKRMFIIIQWLATLTKTQLDDLQSNHERYIASLTDHLYPSVSLREKICQFIDERLLNNSNGDDDLTSKEFVVIRRFPLVHRTNLEKQFDLMRLGWIEMLHQVRENLSRVLICSIWTICCLLESDSFAFELITSRLPSSHSESVCEEDLLIFLLLCAEQNVHLNGAESILHPYLLYSSSHLCTQQQKNWWQSAIESAHLSNDFLDHLRTIRLNDDRTHQHPPQAILFHTARSLFSYARSLYQQCHSKASNYQSRAEEFFQLAKKKKEQEFSDSLNRSQSTQGNKADKLFFFYAQKSLSTEKNFSEECEELRQQCEQCKESKTIKENQSSPIEETTEAEIHVSTVLTTPPRDTSTKDETFDSTHFATPPAVTTYRDIEVQTIFEEEKPTIVEVVVKEEKEEEAMPPTLHLLFNHMNQLNQSIQEFSSQQETIQADIGFIRDRLEQVNRVTSQMLFSSSSR